MGEVGEEVEATFFPLNNLKNQISILKQILLMLEKWVKL